MVTGWLRVVWCCALFGAAIGAVWHRLDYGFSLQDEVLGLAGATRYVLGDTPIVDEPFSLFKGDDVLVGWLMPFVPWNSFLAWRVAGFCFQLACLAAATVFLARLVPFVPLTLLLAALTLYVPLNIWAPTYTNYGVLLILASTSVWLCSVGRAGRWRTIAPLAAGLLFSLCAVDYTPFLGLLIVPVAVAVLPGGTIRRSATLYVLGAAVGLVAVLAVIVGDGLTQRLVGAFGDFRSQLSGIYDFQGNFVTALAYRFIQVGWQLAGSLAVGIGGFAVVGFFANSVQHARTRTVILALATAFVALAALREWLLPPLELLTLAGRFILVSVPIVGLAIGWLVAWLTRSATRRTTLEDPRRILVLIFGSVAVLTTLVLVTLPANGPRQFAMGLWLLWPAAVAVLFTFDTHSRGRTLDRWAHGLVSVNTGLLCLLAVYHLYGFTYFESPLNQLTAQFTTPKLRGVYSTPERVAEVDGIVAAVTQRTRTGDFILTDGDFVGLTYLTNTRPALRASWLDRTRLPDSVLATWLDQMEAAGRTPRYAVVQSPTQNEPRETYLDRYIAQHFAPEMTSGHLTLLVRLDAGP